MTFSCVWLFFRLPLLHSTTTTTPPHPTPQPPWLTHRAALMVISLFYLGWNAKEYVSGRQRQTDFRFKIQQNWPPRERTGSRVHEGGQRVKATNTAHVVSSWRGRLERLKPNTQGVLGPRRAAYLRESFYWVSQQSPRHKRRMYWPKNIF